MRFGADELVITEEAEQRRDNNETMNEDGYVWEPYDFCFNNLAPAINVDQRGHDNNATKNHNPADG